MVEPQRVPYLPVMPTFLVLLAMQNYINININQMPRLKGQRRPGGKKQREAEWALQGYYNRLPSFFSGLEGQLLALLECLLQSTLHVESGLGVIVSLTLQQGREALDRVLQFHELSLPAREDLTHEEGLRQELLDLPGPGHGQLIVLRELVHSQDGNDILKGLVVLQQLLHSSGHLVVLLTHHSGVEDTGGGVEGVDGGVDAELGEGTGEHSGGVQEGEGGGWGGIGEIVGRHVDGLHGSDGALLGGGDSLLEGTEIGGEGGLVTHGRGDTAEQGGHLRAGLGEPEDVVDEEQHVLSLLVSEVLSDSESSESHSGPGSWGLVHLSVDEGAPASGLVNLDDSGLDHLVVEIVALPGPLAHSCEDGVAAVRLGHVVDQLLDDHSLAHSGTAEETDLTSSGVGGEEIDDLDTGDEDLSA